MAEHLYLPDSNNFWYGEFGTLALHQKTLADELFEVFCSTFISVGGDDHHIWVHDIAYSLLATAVGLVVALAPALAAATRDPIRELRVP